MSLNGNYHQMEKQFQENSKMKVFSNGSIVSTTSLEQHNQKLIMRATLIKLALVIRNNIIV